MGTWGPALYSDDFAMDVKREYQTLLAFGTPEERAYDLVKEFFLNNSYGTDDEAVFWLSTRFISKL